MEDRISLDRKGATVQEIRSEAELQRIAGEWSELWDRSNHSTPFQHPAWLLPWWRHLGEGDLWTLVFRLDGKLAGVAPFYVYTKPDTGRRELYLLGMGTSDYLDALYEPGFETQGAWATLAHLWSNSDRWDVIDLHGLRNNSPLLGAPLQDGLVEEDAQGEHCPVLLLDNGVESLPKRMRQNLTYYHGRAEKAGSVRFQRATEDNVQDLFDALLRLHGARWNSKGEAGVLADGAVQQANRESLVPLLRADILRLFALVVEERIVAVYYGFNDPRLGLRKAFYYLSGFDPDFQTISPGTLVIGHAIRDAIDDGAEEFDFLRGQERYKYLWGAADSETFRRRIRKEG